MKINRILWLALAAPLATPLGGCLFLKAPAPDPTPTPAPTPRPPFFDPAAGQPRATPINKAGDPVLPDAFRIAGATTGDTIALQSVDTVTAGQPPKPVVNLGTPDPAKLAGIVAPSAEPGLQEARNAITNWTAGQNLDVDIDGKFPRDLNGMRVVQVFFKGRKGPYEGQTLSLNRMLVRSGLAVVDLYSPTSFDTSEWLYDEAYAKRNKSGFWKYGVAIQQRVPITTSLGTGSRSRVTISPTAGVVGRPNPNAATTSVTTTTRTTTTRAVTTPGAAPATGAAGSATPPGARP